MIAHYERQAVDLDVRAHTYDSPDPYRRWFYRTRFDAVMEMLDPQPGERILDVGAGCGMYTEAILNRGCVVDAMEVGKESLRRIDPRAGRIVGDAERIPGPDDTYDRVLMTEVIEHVNHPFLALLSCERVLKPGGTLVVSTPNRRSPLNLAYRVKRWKRGYVNEHLREFSIREFVRDMSRVVDVQEVRIVNHLMPYPLDLVASRFPGVEVVSAIDRLLAATPLVRRLGWTVIVRGQKP